MSVRIKFKAKRMLKVCSTFGSMLATDKEALIMRVSTILEMSCDDFDPRMFYLKHIDHVGSAYTGLSDNFTDKWAKDLVADALTQLTHDRSKVTVLSPREANGPDGYPKDNPAFREAADKVLASVKEDADQARRFLDALQKAVKENT